jgi:MYXO-CTERM domain-containing protein
MGMMAIAPDFGGAAVAAQSPTPTASTPATTTAPTTIAPAKQDNSGKWGLLGLLGLAGLAGLLKRPHTEVRTVETQRVDPPRDRTR